MTFEQSIHELCRRAHQNSFNHGFWEDYSNVEGPVRRMFLSERIALIHGEPSEALEAIRHGNPPDSHIPEFSGLEAELADTCIRIFDMAGGLNLRLGEAIIAKMKYNESRPYKHGKQA